MKKYITPNAEMVTLDTKDIMIASIGEHVLEDSRPTSNQKGWIPDFDSWSN